MIYYINKKEDNNIYEVKVSLSNDSTVNECVDLAIKMLNVENTNLNLRQENEEYELFYAKKNGQKKEDYPCL